MKAIISVAEWQDYLLNIWPLTTITFCPIGSVKNLPRVGLKFIPYTNIQYIAKCLKNYIKLVNLVKSVHTGYHPDVTPTVL